MLLQTPMFAQLASAVKAFGVVDSLGVNVVSGASGGSNLTELEKTSEAGQIVNAHVSRAWSTNPRDGSKYLRSGAAVCLPS